jgi:uncharacterized protein with FMN-binding domain
MKKSIILSSIIIMAVSISVLCGCSGYKEMKQVRNMSIKEIDLSTVSAGKYRGDFSYGGFTYEVEVSIKGHRIDNITILKNIDSIYAKEAETVIDRVLYSQSLNVDAVSGATTTSKALLKAVEGALSKARTDLVETEAPG